MKKTTTHFIFWGFLFLSNLLLAQSSDKPISEDKIQTIKKKIQKQIDTLHKIHGFVGLNVGFSLPDSRTYGLSTGYSCLAPKTKMKPKDRMLVGGLSKLFFATMTIQMAKEGKIKLDDKISKYLDNEAWFERIPNAKNLTIRMLLNHTTGIPEYYEQGNFMQELLRNPDKNWQSVELLTYIFDKMPLSGAGKNWYYAETNYILLGIILEKNIEQDLFDEINNRLMRRLQLVETERADSRSISRLVVGYSMPKSPFGFEGANLENGLLKINPQYEWTGGGFVSNAEELSIFSKMLFEKHFFDEKWLFEMIVGVESHTGKNHYYGLGVQIRPSAIGTTFGHSGWSAGYLSETVYFPEMKVAVSVQFNTDDLKKLGKLPYDYSTEIGQIIYEVLSTK